MNMDLESMKEFAELIAKKEDPSQLLNWGPFLALCGVGLAATLGAIGSSLGIGKAAQASSGVMSETSEGAGKLLVLSALPGSQVLYGFLGVILFFSFFKIDTLTVTQGGAIFWASMPLGISCLFSGIFQGKVAAAAASVIAKNPSEGGKAIAIASMAEVAALFGLLGTLILFVVIKG